VGSFFGEELVVSFEDPDPDSDDPDSDDFDSDDFESDDFDSDDFDSDDPDSDDFDAATLSSFFSSGSLDFLLPWSVA
jgi:hypothetical protein